MSNSFMISWTIACQAPLSMGFSRQEYWGGLPFPSPGELPNPGIESASPVRPALAGRLFTTEPRGRPHKESLFPKLQTNRPSKEDAQNINTNVSKDMTSHRTLSLTATFQRLQCIGYAASLMWRWQVFP